MHNLKLFVRDSHADTSRLIVTDISEYDDLLAVTNPTVFIQPPGFDAKEVLFSRSRTNAFSSRNLGITTGKVLSPLPDMLYTITYSVVPASKTFITVYHFRTAFLEQRLFQLIADVRTNEDPYRTEALTAAQTVYLQALLILEGLKGELRDDGDLTKATTQYQEVERILNNLKLDY